MGQTVVDSLFDQITPEFETIGDLRIVMLIVWNTSSIYEQSLVSSLKHGWTFKSRTSGVGVLNTCSFLTSKNCNFKLTIIIYRNWLNNITYSNQK